MQPISGRGRRRTPRDPGGHGLCPESVPRPVTAAALFGNDRPLELEIGSGKGTFLLAESGARPEVNFLGIEYARRYWTFAADRLRRGERANARVVLAEASTFLREFIPDESLSAVHVYFPDPWPKTRHHRRRLLNSAFLKLIASKLEPGGRLSIATDHREYFDKIALAVKGSPADGSRFQEDQRRARNGIGGLELRAQVPARRPRHSSDGGDEAHLKTADEMRDSLCVSPRLLV